MNKSQRFDLHTFRPTARLAGAALLIAGAAFLATSARAGNTLTNADFELGTLTGWTGYGSRAVESTNNTYYNGGNPGGSNVLTHSGMYVGKTWGQFSGGPNTSGVYQDTVAGAGSIWSALGYALSHEQDLIQPNDQFWLEVTFRDAGDQILSMYKSYVLDPLSDAGVTSNLWYTLSVTNQIDISDPAYTTVSNTVASFTAPTGTAKVRFQVVFSQIGYAGGSVYYDDLVLNKLAGTDPDITVSPASHVQITRHSVSFSVTAVGSTTLAYQWRKDANPLTDGGNISGATASTVTVGNLALTDAGVYDVLVTDANGSILSAPATLIVVTPEDAANCLYNPGLESGTFPPYWSPYNGAGIPAAPPVTAHGGTNVGQAYGLGSGSYNGFYQDVKTDDIHPVGAGSVFTADGWVYASSSDPLTADNTAWVETHFHDGGGNMIGLYKSAIIDANFPTDTWVNLPVTNIIAFWGDYSVVGNSTYLTAPAGTAYVRYQTVLHVGTGGGTGSVYFDDMRLMQKLPTTITFARNGTAVTISFLTQGATSYQVVYKNNLSDPAWSVLTTIDGDGAFKSTSDTIGPANRYYRVNTL